MHNIQCAGQRVEVEGYPFLVGYSSFGWIHSSGLPHVWAEASHCKVIAAATPESRELALQQLQLTAADRRLPPEVKAALKEAAQRAEALALL